MYHQTIPQLCYPQLLHSHAEHVSKPLAPTVRDQALALVRQVLALLLPYLTPLTPEQRK